MKNRLRFVFALLCGAVVSLAQQDTGMITGQVTDGNGLAVPGAAVSVNNRDTNVGIQGGNRYGRYLRGHTAEDRNVFRSGGSKGIQKGASGRDSASGTGPPAN